MLLFQGMIYSVLILLFFINTTRLRFYYFITDFTASRHTFK